MKTNDLFSSKKDCCGCNACFNACPKNAIMMKNDEYGYKYPHIDESKCIDCGLCKRVCNFKNSKLENSPIKAYAAMSTNDNLLFKSASGGVFSSLAYNFINDGGVVYGSSMERKDNFLKTHHIRIDCLDDIKRIQGSKYVQSDVEDTFRKVKVDLINGLNVLFTGTPCQIDGLYGYLGNKKYNNLFTIDIICHGVPNEVLLNEYIKTFENRLNCNVENILFRDKCNGWSLKGNIIYSKNNNILYKKEMPLQGFSYYKLFLDSVLYRENCYSCRYASTNRPGDITIGDYWGIEIEHPEMLDINGGKLCEQKGISCIIVNTNQGSSLIDKYGSLLILNESNVQSVKRANYQLQYPSKKPKDRTEFLEIFKNNGYKQLEKIYYKKFGIKSLLYKVWNYLPGKKIDNFR